MHSEAYRKSIAVKRGSHNPHPALSLPLSDSSCPLQSSFLCFFLHSLSSSISHSSPVLSPFHVHFQPCPFLCFCRLVPHILFPGCFSLFILASRHCCAGLVSHPVSKTSSYCRLLVYFSWNNMDHGHFFFLTCQNKHIKIDDNFLQPLGRRGCVWKWEWFCCLQTLTLLHTFHLTQQEMLIGQHWIQFFFVFACTFMWSNCVL